jgi:hypothetical protein
MIEHINDQNDSCILLFIKRPVAGTVKTRLAESIGAENATGLYRRFVLDLLTLLEGLAAPFRICYAPSDAEGDTGVEDDAENEFVDWLGCEYSYVPQIGKDLGERMKNALLEAFSDGYKRALVIGSDSPDLPEAIISQAITALHSHLGPVIGPANDGGYYLIGFSKERFLPHAFDDITWSTDSVFDRTMQIFAKHDQRAHTLPKWHDVDTIGDLKLLIGRSVNSDFSKSQTISYINNTDLGATLNVRL